MMTRAGVPLVDLGAQYETIREEIGAAIQRVLESSAFILGEEVERFEASFSEFVGARETVGVASGTAAIHLALQACGVGPGDEVITAAHTFIATAEPISNLGAKPVFADIDPATYTMDPDHAESLIGPRTKAILPIHLYGQAACMDRLREISERHNLRLIEDAAQAHGAEYQGQRVGSLGHLACFSFYPGKNLGAYGDAGAVTGTDERLLGLVRKLRDHGRTSKYEHELIGTGERLDALQAAILSTKLIHLEAWTEARREHARRYRKGLAGSDLVLPQESPDARHVYHLFVVRARERDKVLKGLRDVGIGAGVHYPLPLHRQPAYLNQGYGSVTLPQTELAAAEVLSLPMYAELTDQQIDEVVQQVRKLVA
jgi:dTDP-4-amino-4,6-dideoxygalactose transaminase